MADTQGNDALDLLRPENVRFVDHFDDWRQAIRESLKSLEQGGYVSPEYAENIIKDTLEVGPYYVLTNNVALIHARPEEGAIRTQLSITRLEQPFYFKADEIPDSGMPVWPVRLIFSLAAENSDSHVDIIRIIASVCMDDDAVEALLQKESPEALYEAFMSAGRVFEG